MDALTSIIDDNDNIELTALFHIHEFKMPCFLYILINALDDKVLVMDFTSNFGA
jgi:hypothetical protein